ncbi:unnamed protein product, partial [Didymodactylos carnosus]
FLNRSNQNRSALYELIKNEHLHAVLKWSRKTPECNKELEFRYSFSKIEMIFAQNRSENQTLLYGIARSIYYKHLYKQTQLSSYIVKTTVMWMCELMTFEDNGDK